MGYIANVSYQQPFISVIDQQWPRRGWFIEEDAEYGRIETTLPAAISHGISHSELLSAQYMLARGQDQ